MHQQIIEIVKDTRDSSIQRNAFDLQKIADNIKLMLENVYELNHIDYDYVAVLLEKSKTLMCTANFVLENYMNK